MSASGSPWFVRSGKRVQGPFSTEQLQSLKTRGRLTDAHELSQDRVTWRTMSELAIFQDHTAGGDFGYALQPDAGAGTAAGQRGDGAAWFYAAGQEQRGPVDTLQLQQMLRTQEISPTTLVWKDGFATWVPARDVPEFAGVQPLTGSGAQPGSQTPPAQTFSSPGMEGVPRTAASVAILSFFTLGFYLFVWYFATRKELVAQGARIPPAWQLLIPFWNLYWFWMWCAGVSNATQGRIAAPLLYITWLLEVLMFVPTVGIATAAWAGWVQSQLNAAQG